MFNRIKQLFSPHLLVTSQPYERGREWVYFFGNEQGFEIRGFESQEQATSSRRLLLSAIDMAPEVSTRRFVISSAKAQSVRDMESYSELLRSLSETGRNSSEG
jgi:hypothetical protein